MGVKFLNAPIYFKMFCSHKDVCELIFDLVKLIDTNLSRHFKLFFYDHHTEQFEPNNFTLSKSNLKLSCDLDCLPYMYISRTEHRMDSRNLPCDPMINLICNLAMLRKISNSETWMTFLHQKTLFSAYQLKFVSSTFITFHKYV